MKIDINKDNKNSRNSRQSRYSNGIINRDYTRASEKGKNTRDFIENNCDFIDCGGETKLKKKILC